MQFRVEKCLPNNKVITLGPIGCSSGTTRISVLTNWIHPLALSVIACNWIIELGGSGSLSAIVPITLSVSFTSRSTICANRNVVSSQRSVCVNDRWSNDRPPCDKLSGKSSDVLLRHKHRPIFVVNFNKKNLSSPIIFDRRSSTRHTHTTPTPISRFRFFWMQSEGARDRFATTFLRQYLFAVIEFTLGTFFFYLQVTSIHTIFFIDLITIN